MPLIYLHPQQFKRTTIQENWLYLSTHNQCEPVEVFWLRGRYLSCHQYTSNSNNSRELVRATPTHVEYWEVLMVVCEWELGEARRKDAIDRATVRFKLSPAELLAEERGLHSSIETDVRDLLEGKTHKELVALQAKIESGMHSGEAKVVEYREAVLKRLHISKAMACLREIHAKLLRKHLHRLEQPGKGDNLKSEDENVEEEEIEPEVEDTRTFSPEPIVREEPPEFEAEEGSFSPQLLHGEDAEEANDPDEDRATLEKKRLAVPKEQQRRLKEAMASKPSQPDDDFEVRARKVMGAMEEGDALFGSGTEINLDLQVYWCHDKYCPIKPKYN